MNLIEGLLKELERNRELLQAYKEIPTGVFGSLMIELKIKETEKIMAEGDIVKMLGCYKALQESN